MLSRTSTGISRVWNDLKILYHLTLAPVRGETHADRLESFYSGQAEGYDDFRERLLAGRRELAQALPLPAGGTWVDCGAGTGANVEFVGDRIRQPSRVYLVDLSPSLLKVADTRIAQRGWTNVETVVADVTQFQPSQQVDLVTFSYSLTMIPGWYAAIDRAWENLKPGGVIGVVDFHVAPKHPREGRTKHSWLTRAGIPLWFGFDNVFPSPDHLGYLEHRFETIRIEEHRSRIPYLPFARAPYYIFLGRKRLDSKCGD